MAEPIPERNPLVNLPERTVQFLKFLRNSVGREPAHKDQELSAAALSATKLMESLSSYGWLPEGLDRQRYVEVVAQIAEIEAELPRSNPSIAVEDIGLLLRGKVDAAKELGSLQAELVTMDAQLSQQLFITPTEAQAHVSHPNAEQHLRSFDHDKTEQAAQVERASARKHMRIAAQIQVERDNGPALNLREDIRKNIDRMRSGHLDAEELAALPEKGIFQLLDDSGEPVREKPVQVYERQIVKTNRDITSPDFSGCATVLLYKETVDGSPEPESIFAHLPPRTDNGFETYGPSFWKKQANITDLSGYKAKVVAGLISSPEEIAHGLRQLGAEIVTLEQIPLEMYRVLVDAKTKSIVASGELEAIDDTGRKAYYRTKGGRLNVRKEPDIPGITYIE